MNPADKYPPPKFFDIDETSPFYPVWPIVIVYLVTLFAFFLRFDSRTQTYVDKNQFLAAFIIIFILVFCFIVVLIQSLNSFKNEQNFQKKFRDFDFLGFTFWFCFSLIVGFLTFKTVCFSNETYKSLRTVAGLGPGSAIMGMLPGLFVKLVILIINEFKKRINSGVYQNEKSD